MSPEDNDSLQLPANRSGQSLLRGCCGSYQVGEGTPYISALSYSLPEVTDHLNSLCLGTCNNGLLPRLRVPGLVMLHQEMRRTDLPPTQ